MPAFDLQDFSKQNVKNKESLNSFPICLSTFYMLSQYRNHNSVISVQMSQAHFAVISISFNYPTTPNFAVDLWQEIIRNLFKNINNVAQCSVWVGRSEV